MADKAEKTSKDINLSSKRTGPVAEKAKIDIKKVAN